MAAAMDVNKARVIASSDVIITRRSTRHGRPTEKKKAACRSGDDSDEESYECEFCEYSGQKSVVECEKCHKWGCPECSHLPSSVHKLMGKWKTLHWYCEDCEVEVQNFCTTTPPKDPKAKDDDKDQTPKTDLSNSTFEGRMAKMEKRMEDMISSNEQFVKSYAQILKDGKVPSQREARPRKSAEGNVSVKEGSEANLTGARPRDPRKHQEQEQDTPVAVDQINRRDIHRKRTARVIVGDSMISQVRKHVKMEAEGSKNMCLKGKDIKDVMDEARKCGRELQEGLLIIQGGGNNLTQLGAEDTVKEVIEGIKKVKAQKKNLRVGFVGILRRPKESMKYEYTRRKVNRKIAEELCKMKMDYMKNDDIGVSFLDLDGELTGNRFARDQVHLDNEGVRDLGKRILEWILASERLHKGRLEKRASRDDQSPDPEEPANSNNEDIEEPRRNPVTEERVVEVEAREEVPVPVVQYLDLPVPTVPVVGMESGPATRSVTREEPSPSEDQEETAPVVAAPTEIPVVREGGEAPDSVHESEDAGKN